MQTSTLYGIQATLANRDICKVRFFLLTFWDWNDLEVPDSLVFSAEVSDDCVYFSCGSYQSAPLVTYFHVGVSPVRYSDCDC